MEKKTFYVKCRVHSLEYGSLHELIQINAYGCDPEVPENCELVDREVFCDKVDQVINQVSIGSAAKCLVELESGIESLVVQKEKLELELHQLRSAIAYEMQKQKLDSVVVDGVYLSLPQDGGYSVNFKKVTML